MANKKYFTEEERKAATVRSCLASRNRHRDKFDAYHKKYRMEHPEKVHQWNQKQYYKDPQARADYSKKKREELRSEVITAYGGKCQCCNIDTWEFLTVDHIPGYQNMAHDKRGPRGSTSLYRWLKKNSFPKEDFCLLCMNCNTAKSWWGECPHEAERRREEITLVQSVLNSIAC